MIRITPCQAIFIQKLCIVLIKSDINITSEVLFVIVIVPLFMNSKINRIAESAGYSNSHNVIRITYGSLLVFVVFNFYNTFIIAVIEINACYRIYGMNLLIVNFDFFQRILNYSALIIIFRKVKQTILIIYYIIVGYSLVTGKYLGIAHLTDNTNLYIRLGLGTYLPFKINFIIYNTNSCVGKCEISSVPFLLYNIIVSVISEKS